MGILHKDQKIEYLKTILNKKHVLNMEELSIYTGLKPKTIYYLTSKRIIPHSKPNGKKLFFSRKEIDKWLLSARVKSNHEIEKEALQYALNNKR